MRRIDLITVRSKPHFSFIFLCFIWGISFQCWANPENTASVMVDEHADTVSLDNNSVDFPNVNIQLYQKELDEFQRLQRESQLIRLKLFYNDLRIKLQESEAKLLPNSLAPLSIPSVPKQPEIEVEQESSTHNKQRNDINENVREYAQSLPQAKVISIVGKGKKYQAKIYDKQYGLKLVSVGDKLSSDYVIYKIESDRVLVKGKNASIVALSF